MRFHSAGRSLRWGADDECIVRLISGGKKCGGYGHQRCVCMYACVCLPLRQKEKKGLVVQVCMVKVH